MTKEATQQGVSRRDKEMEALLQRRREEQGLKEEPKDDQKPVEDDQPAEESEKVKEKPKEESESSEAFEFIGDDGSVIKVPRSSRLRTKVDGEEHEETLEKISRSYQKGAAGDKRLQEAAIIKKQLEDKERELTQREKDFIDKAQQLEDNDEGLSDDAQKALAGKLVNALMDADEDTAAELLGSIFPKKAELPNIDKEIEFRLEKRDKERAAQKWSEDVKASVERFQEEYKDLAADTFLNDMVDRRTIINQQENPKASPWEIVKQSADEVRDWLNKKAGTKTAKPSPPTPASGRSVIKEESKPKTRADVIADMKRSRGQPL